MAEKGFSVRYRWLALPGRRMRLMILAPAGADQAENSQKRPGVLWLHGGGYMTGFPEMAFRSRAHDLAQRGGALVLCPAYRLSLQAPYPAGLKDAYAALLYMKENADALGIRTDQLMVGGESAGGGLAAALTILARARGDVRIAYQMPLYPMLDCEDTPSSRDNHAPVWNTSKNHFAWRLYLRSCREKTVSPLASPARLRDFSGLPPAYTFVGTDEPFYDETLQYFAQLRAAGVEAEAEIFSGCYHAFDMKEPERAESRVAAESFLRHFLYARARYFAPQKIQKERGDYVRSHF